MELNLINSDVIDALAQMPGESVDVVVTSPDYNLGVMYKAGQKVRQLNDYLAWACRWGREVMRVLKPEGSFFLNVAGAPSRPLLPFHLVLAFSDFTVLQNTFHWVKAITIHKEGLFDKKGNPLDPRLSVGHFKPISSDRFVNDQHEYVFHFSKTGKARLHRKSIGVPYVDETNIKRWGHTGGANLRCRGNTWYCPYKTIQNRNKQRPHPASFPPEVPEYAMRLAGANSESTVMDIFLGLGNSGIAAQRIPVKRFIGIDNEPFYVTESRQRIESSITV